MRLDYLQRIDLGMGLEKQQHGNVAVLAEVVVDAARLGLDPGDMSVLERYECWRRFDGLALARIEAGKVEMARQQRGERIGLTGCGWACWCSVCHY